MEPKKLRILFNTNSPWSPSGYGQQAAEILPQIRDEGYHLGCVDFFGLEGGKLLIDGILHYPKINHLYGSDAMVHHGAEFGADVVMSLQDIWVLNPQDLSQIKRWIPVLPIDHDPAPGPILDKLKYAYRIVTYSKFGQDELARRGFNSTYIQHTVDTEIFKPMDKKALRREFGMPEDAFIWGMVAANKDNPPRKSFQEVMDAFVVFLKKAPKSLLYLHTIPDFPGGFPIKEYAHMLGILDKLILPKPYDMQYKIQKPDMAKVYNIMDVLLLPSVSEGFGVPAIEAQSCGVPAVVNNFTSMPELVQNHITGEVCELLYRRFSPLLSYVGVPSAKSVYDCVCRIKDSNRELMGKAARQFIVDNYDSKKVFKEKWVPFLSQIEKEIYP